MDIKLYNQIVAWAKNAKEDDLCSMEGRKAKVTNMAGGRFLLTESNTPMDEWGAELEDNVVGQCDAPEAVAIYILTGKVIKA